MKTLKELNEKCVLFAEFKNPAFICRTTNLAVNYNARPIKAAIYYDNKGKYYVYDYITDATITEYDNIKDALDKFTRFIHNVVE